MAFLEELESRYRTMDDHEFVLLAREDLTVEARSVYDKEVMRRNRDEHLEKIYRSMADTEFDLMQLKDLMPNAQKVYEKERLRRLSPEYQQAKEQQIMIHVGHNRLIGGLLLAVAGINTLAYFIAGPYPSLRMFYMLILAVLGLRHLTGTAFSVNYTNQEITFFALVGPFQRKVKYTALELEGAKIFFIAEKDGKRQKLTRLSLNKNDLQVLREQIRKLERRGIS